MCLTKQIKSNACNTAPIVNRGLVGHVPFGSIGVRVRRVVNGSKAPAGRFRSMSPRRPLVGEVMFLPSIH